MTDDLADLELAAALVHDAGQLAADMLRAGLETMHKSSISDVVSAADHAAEELVVNRLRAERPDDGLVGEEGTNVPADETGRTWYIDPVDGTYNFLSGLQSWCSALALADASYETAGPILGAIYQPSAGELWLGGRNHPTTCNGVPVVPLTDRPLAELCVATYLHPPTMSDDELRLPLLRVIEGAATIRMLGSASVEMGALADGRLGLWIQHGSFPWDWLPGVAIVRAAGGVAETVTIGAHRWHIAGNRQAVAEAKALLLNDSDASA